MLRYDNNSFISNVGLKFILSPYKDWMFPISHNIFPNTNQVLPDGTYVPPMQKKASYSTMVFVRMAICIDGLEYLKKAATIAIRYSAVRRQVSLDQDILNQHIKL